MEEHWPLFPKDFPKCGVFVFLFWMGQWAQGLVVIFFFADYCSLKIQCGF